MVWLMTRMSRLLMSMMTGWLVWARPMPMWCMRPARRSETDPVLSTRSCLIRWWGPVVVPAGPVLGSLV